MGIFGNNTREPEKIERDIDVLDEEIKAQRKGKGDPELDEGDLVTEKLEKMAERDKAKRDREDVTDKVFDAFF